MLFSGHTISQLPASENMKVQMRDRLAGIRATIGYYTIPAGKAVFSSYFCNSTQACGNFRVLHFIHIRYRGNMFLRNNQCVKRSLRINVHKRINQIVFIYFCGWDFAINDSAEETFVRLASHSWTICLTATWISLICELIFWRYSFSAALPFTMQRFFFLSQEEHGSLKGFPVDRSCIAKRTRLFSPLSMVKLMNTQTRPKVSVAFFFSTENVGSMVLIAQR